MKHIYMIFGPIPERGHLYSVISLDQKLRATQARKEQLEWDWSPSTT